MCSCLCSFSTTKAERTFLKGSKVFLKQASSSPPLPHSGSQCSPATCWECPPIFLPPENRGGFHCWSLWKMVAGLLEMHVAVQLMLYC